MANDLTKLAEQITYFGADVLRGTRAAIRVDVWGGESYFLLDHGYGEPVTPETLWQCVYCGGMRQGEQCRGCGAPRTASLSRVPVLALRGRNR